MGDRTQPEWVAANEVEREMADALAGADGQAYARLLTSAPLFVPDLPAEDEAAQQVAGMLPPGARYVLVYTSPQTLAVAMGEHAQGYQQVDFDGLRQGWPDPEHRLAVNPGSPIAVFLPLPAVAELAAGGNALLSTEAFQDALQHEVPAAIRDICLRDLSGRSGARDAGDTELRDDPPVNELEEGLRQAIAGQDSDGYLAALLAAEVVLPTTGPVSDPGRIYDDAFPWRITGAEQAPSVPLFSSGERLRRLAAGPVEQLVVPFVDVLANWPDEQYGMCVNPGSVDELILPAAAVAELLSVFDSMLAQHAGAAPDS